MPVYKAKGADGIKALWGVDTDPSKIVSGGPYILKLMGQTGINVFTRLMGLLVMVIGVQFVLDGLSTVVEGLLG